MERELADKTGAKIYMHESANVNYDFNLDIFNYMWERATIGSIDKAKIV
jgi:hypothetical protein